MRLGFWGPMAIFVSTIACSAQDMTPNGIARSVSLFSAIADYCPSHVKVDPEQARKFVNVYMQVGSDIEGAAAFKVRLGQEASRRSKEVEITGPLQWCERQRAFVQSVGDKAVFP
jgi:hypothetical protein